MSSNWEVSMRSLVLSAAAMMALAAMLIPAQADLMWGPVKNGNQCFQSSPGWNRDGFGAWSSCPAPASTPVATKPAPRAKRHVSR
jgi:hypothetical protein